MSNRRIIVLVVDDIDTAEDLSALLIYAIAPPWKPVPPGENLATYQQERWSWDDTDPFLLERLKRAAPRIHWISNTLIPEESDD